MYLHNIHIFHDIPWQATPSFAPTSLAPEPPNLASQLNALLTRRGGPVEVAAGDGDGIFVGFYRDLMFFFLLNGI